MSGGEPTPSSPRIMLATLAHQAVADTPGVRLTSGDGDRWVTVDRDHRIAGVTAVASPGGRFELGLHLDVDWPPEPLHELADDLRTRVRTAAARASLDRALGDVLVTIADVKDPDGSEAIA